MTTEHTAKWTVAEDGWGDPTIWTDGDHAVATRRGDRIHIDPAFADQVWSLLTAGLAPDEATIERLGQGIHARMCCRLGATNSAYRAARETLAALTDTPTQTRHTADIDSDQIHDHVEVDTDA